MFNIEILSGFLVVLARVPNASLFMNIWQIVALTSSSMVCSIDPCSFIYLACFPTRWTHGRTSVHPNISQTLFISWQKNRKTPTWAKIHMKINFWSTLDPKLSLCQVRHVRKYLIWTVPIIPHLIALEGLINLDWIIHSHLYARLK